jgi:hypothetical protein
LYSTIHKGGFCIVNYTQGGVPYSTIHKGGSV